MGWATFVSTARDHGEPSPPVVIYGLREARHDDDRVVEPKRDIHILSLAPTEGFRNFVFLTLGE